MNDLDKELTEIIADLMLRTGKLKAEDNPKIFKQGLQYIKAHDEAKAKIQELITQARIDELKRQLDFVGKNSSTDSLLGLSDRLAQLQEENK